MITLVTGRLQAGSGDITGMNTEHYGVVKDMADKSLLSLTEIAEELHLNYRNIVNYKNQFQEFLPGMFDGRDYKYYTDCIDLFQLIYALRQEGYTFKMIRQTFLQQIDLPQNIQLREWVEIWLKKYGKLWAKAGLQWGINYHQSGSIRINPDQSRSIESGSDQSGLNSINHEQSGFIQSTQDQSGSSQIDQGENGNLEDQTKLRKELQDELPSLVTNQVQEEITRQLAQILTSLEDALLRLTSEINSSMTQLYKAIQEIQTGMRSLDSRLGKLEEDLGEGRSQEMSLEDLDLDELQVASPELEMDHDNPESLQHAEMESTEEKLPQQVSMEFVRASVHNGRPNKQAMVHWIKAQKEQNPGLSYGELANRLNEAGIPTLSGRDEWSRSVVRNLAVRGNGG